MPAIAFKYELPESGVAVAQLTCDDMFVDFNLNNSCNPINELLHVLVNQIITPSHLWGEDNKSLVTWYGEGESYNWEIELRIDDLGQYWSKLRVTQQCDFFGDESMELLQTECLFTDLVHAIVAGLDVLVKKIGLLNYLQLWGSDEFPTSYFLFLKKYLIDNGKWNKVKAATRVSSAVLSQEILLLMA